MSKITINIQTGGLGRQSASQDKWAGVFVQVDAMPSVGGGWTENEVKRIFRVEDLEVYGITATATNPYFQLVYWHVSEVFRIEPASTVYVQLALAANADANTVMTAFKDAESRLRLFCAVTPAVTISAVAVTAWQTELESLFNSFVQPSRLVLTLKKDVGDTIPDLSTSSDDRIMVDISNDATTGGLASTIFASAVGMCGGGGTILGQLLKLAVHQKPSWKKFPVNSSDRWVELADINGDSVEKKTPTEIEAYATQGLNLITRTIRQTDAFVSNARTAISTDDDYAIITNGRVIDKAIVLVYDALVKNLDGPVYVNPSNGTLTPETVARFENAAWEAINNNMVVGRVGDAVEVSVDPSTGSLPRNAVFVDPSQDTLTTEKVTVEVRIVPVGSSKEIVINIGLVASLS